MLSLSTRFRLLGDLARALFCAGLSPLRNVETECSSKRAIGRIASIRAHCLAHSPRAATFFHARRWPALSDGQSPRAASKLASAALVAMASFSVFSQHSRERPRMRQAWSAFQAERLSNSSESGAFLQICSAKRAAFAGVIGCPRMWSQTAATVCRSATGSPQPSVAENASYALIHRSAKAVMKARRCAGDHAFIVSPTWRSNSSNVSGAPSGIVAFSLAIIRNLRQAKVADGHLVVPL